MYVYRVSLSLSFTLVLLWKFWLQQEKWHSSMESDGTWPVPGTASDRGRKMAGKRSNNMQRYQEIQEIQYRNWNLGFTLTTWTSPKCSWGAISAPNQVVSVLKQLLLMFSGPLKMWHLACPRLFGPVRMQNPRYQVSIPSLSFIVGHSYGGFLKWGYPKIIHFKRVIIDII